MAKQFDLWRYAAPNVLIRINGHGPWRTHQGAYMARKRHPDLEGTICLRRPIEGEYNSENQIDGGDKR